MTYLGAGRNRRGEGMRGKGGKKAHKLEKEERVLGTKEEEGKAQQHLSGIF